MTLRILSVILLLMLVGCAQHPKKPVQMPTKQVQKGASLDERYNSHVKNISANQNWQAQGRLAASNGNKGGNASFVWTQKGESYQIKLFGPFGSGSVYITGHPTFVELKEANGKTTRAQTPESLLKKVAGWQVPLTGLRYWMRGIPAPSAAPNSQKIAQNGVLERLVQQGWHIDYENYQESSPLLPSKLRLQNGNIKVKMIVTEWTVLK
ncbi:MAG: outer membrane lipoprotein LolB [Proteobacteria bacterium]|nr:outer membrane lipoprotein LolB [Pseudomonadota bacterium]